MDFPLVANTLDDLDLPRRPLHLAVGMFDGVHLGHQAVIDAAKQSANRSEGIVGVLTFDPHPSHLFRPNDPTPLLMPRKAKEAFLQKLGVDLTVFQHFSSHFAAVEPEDFPGYLKDRLPHLAALYVGENFRFGKKRRGDVAMLIEAASRLGVSVFSVERIRENGDPISSTRIRKALSEGEIERVNALLGYRYTVQGIVESGRKLGRTLGFPTLNIRWEPALKPKFGVYCVRVRTVGSCDAYVPGVANYGLRPTVEDHSAVAPLLEVHLLKDINWAEGDALEVNLEKFLRPEKKFEDFDNLKKQIAADKAEAKKYYNT